MIDILYSRSVNRVIWDYVDSVSVSQRIRASLVSKMLGFKDDFLTHWIMFLVLVITYVLLQILVIVICDCLYFLSLLFVLRVYHAIINK